MVAQQAPLVLELHGTPIVPPGIAIYAWPRRSAIITGGSDVARSSGIEWGRLGGEGSRCFGPRVKQTGGESADTIYILSREERKILRRRRLWFGVTFKLRRGDG